MRLDSYPFYIDPSKYLAMVSKLYFVKIYQEKISYKFDCVLFCQNEQFKNSDGTFLA